MLSVFDRYLKQNNRHPNLVQSVEFSLSAGTGETTLVSVTAGQLFFIHRISIAVVTAGALALWSGSVAAGQRMTGNMTLPAVLNTIEDLFSHAAGSNFVMNRISSIAVTGNIIYSLV